MSSSSPPTTPAEKERVPPAQSPPRPAHVELTVINPVLSVVASSKPKPLFTRANSWATKSKRVLSVISSGEGQQMPSFHWFWVLFFLSLQIAILYCSLRPILKDRLEFF
ncbi:hypothetical protein TrLO_g13839 [Triparma laevis f. longispina]|uniref:Uncharacterized protein n=1 Tax=Triparma laevis f. longispina TaxID=1714387 RepID=A0A9W7AJH5_9STRA|nr:hypothetical protein TrLO_g13839 [Triparma laevis f. longispina]